MVLVKIHRQNQNRKSVLNNSDPDVIKKQSATLFQPKKSQNMSARTKLIQYFKNDPLSKNKYQKWRKFYKPQFNTINEFYIFIDKCLEADNRVNLVLNRGMRLIKLADKSRFSPSLQIFYLIVCSESMMRIIQNKECQTGVSEGSFVNFCESNFDKNDKVFFEDSLERLLNEDHYNEKLSFQEIMRFFYKVRCKVAHNGEYWNFHWSRDDADMVNFVEYEDKSKKNKKDSFVVKSGVGYQQIREIFIRAIINAVKKVVCEDTK